MRITFRLIEFVAFSFAVASGTAWWLDHRPANAFGFVILMFGIVLSFAGLVGAMIELSGEGR